MTGSAACEVIGRWRIVSSDLWDGDYLDLVDPAYIDIGGSGRGELVFGVVTASLDLSYSRTIVFFTFEGCDEDNEVTGSGSAELLEDGTLELEISFHRGDDAVLRAERDPSSTPC
jgi:hypothetical protein